MLWSSPVEEVESDVGGGDERSHHAAELRPDQPGGQSAGSPQPRPQVTWLTWLHLVHQLPMMILHHCTWLHVQIVSLVSLLVPQFCCFCLSLDASLRLYVLQMKRVVGEKLKLQTGS